MRIYYCSSDRDFEVAKELTEDYMRWLKIDLCFQDTVKEFAEFPKMYGAERGCFLYIKHQGCVAGGVGFRKYTNDICDMKRLFVYDKYRGHGYGKLLCVNLIEQAKLFGYKYMVLDTVSHLKSANALYESLGFYDIPAYYHNPQKTVRYMRKALHDKR